MCINPSFVWMELGAKHVRQPVPCRSCWRCKENRLNDYVGRAMCEASVSEVCVTLTLTYAPRDDLADKVLLPRHFQNFMKLLRRSGHLVRYLVCGEYGDLKARAHFHCILFFTKLLDSPTGEIPGRGTTDAPFCRQIPHKRICHIREWPHGHIIADWSASERSARYVCKYLLSDDKNNAWFSLSKKPPLGAAWFARKAERSADLSVLPSSFEYIPPGVSSSARAYMMTGATRREYLNAVSTDPAVKARLSEWVLKTFEKGERKRWLDEINSQSPESAFALMLEKYLDMGEKMEPMLAAQQARDRWAEFLAGEFDPEEFGRRQDVETIETSAGIVSGQSSDEWA